MMTVYEFLNNTNVRNAWCRFAGAKVYLRRTPWGIDIANVEANKRETDWPIIEGILDQWEDAVGIRIEYTMDEIVVGKLMLRPGWRVRRADPQLDSAPTFANEMWIKADPRRWE